ncbi:hypothetical protein AWB67_06230 [Caballeronia terrestris]|jgi:hypothetical protein|uniref:Uncharacterized protein n=2 Tax=Caballeronia TaxID=1827195 RepID=A0A158KPA1_9BURK|nr:MULTISPECIES: hypothetical protein [Caballeronia]SAL31373.1 hypothetical protein AWB65_01992 [Caballeronia humi]SAL82815.1 hypothetical protein AWB67_06230 [Caballeronia terrestris]
MSKLTIRDLSNATELGRAEMSAVRGGTFYFPGYSVSKTDFSFDTQQAIGQTQNVHNLNGNNVAFATDIDSKVKPIQKADNSNTINVYGGGAL